MSDCDRLCAFVAIVNNMRAAQRDFHAGGRTTVAEARRLEAAVDHWLDENGFSRQQRLFVGDGNLVTRIS